MRAYARLRGCSLAAVQRALQSGRIRANPDGTLDPAIANAQWAENTRARLGNGAEGISTTFMKAKARRESALAGLSELELAARSGELILVDDAAKMWENAIERMKSKWLASISRTAPRLVGLRTVAQAHGVLESIVYDVLAAGAEVADEIERGDEGRPD